MEGGKERKVERISDMILVLFIVQYCHLTLQIIRITYK